MSCPLHCWVWSQQPLRLLKPGCYPVTKQNLQASEQQSTVVWSVRSGDSLSLKSRTSILAARLAGWRILDTQREAHRERSQVLSGKTADHGPAYLGCVVVVALGRLTWKSDAPRIGGGRRGCGGRASQCVSMEEPTPPRLSDDLEGKEERLRCVAPVCCYFN